MNDRLRTVGTGCLAVIAIVGLLSMHGLVASIGPPTAAQHHSTESDASSHRVLGLCLFVVGLVGSGLAARALARQRPASANLAGRFPVPLVQVPPLVAMVRSRSIELCVLRV